MPEFQTTQEMVASVLAQIKSEKHPPQTTMLDAFAEALQKQPVSGNLAKSFA